MRFRSKDNAAIPVHRYIHDAPRYIMHDRGTIPPRFHYSFPTDTLYLSFSTYNIQYLSRTVIFPRAVRIFRTGLPAAVSKSWLERGNDPLFLHHFPYESTRITISSSFFLSFYALGLLGGRKLAMESYLYWVDWKIRFEGEEE